MKLIYNNFIGLVHMKLMIIFAMSQFDNINDSFQALHQSVV